MSDALEKLEGHAADRADICYDCHGPLRGQDGTYHERLEEKGNQAFAACICQDCHVKHEQEESAEEERRQEAVRGRGGRKRR